MKLEQMTIDEFILIVKRRQELLIKSNKIIGNKEKKEIMEELIKIEDVFLTPEEKMFNFKDREKIVDCAIKSKIWIELDEVIRFVKETLGSDYSCKFYRSNNDIYRYIIKIVDKNGNVYKLFDGDYYVDLNMLYSHKYYKDWNKLFKQDPELKERIWNWVKQNVINKDKQKQDAVEL